MRDCQISFFSFFSLSKRKKIWVSEKIKSQELKRKKLLSKRFQSVIFVFLFSRKSLLLSIYPYRCSKTIVVVAGIVIFYLFLFHYYILLCFLFFVIYEYFSFSLLINKLSFYICWSVLSDDKKKKICSKSFVCFVSLLTFIDVDIFFKLVILNKILKRVTNECMYIDCKIMYLLFQFQIRNF